MKQTEIIKFSAAKTFSLMKTLIKYDIKFKRNNNNSVTFYLNDTVYLVYGKSNRVIQYKNNKDRICLDVTLLQFIKEQQLEIKYEPEVIEALAYTIYFGKYKYKCIAEIANLDLSYLNWLVSDTTEIKNSVLIENIKYLFSENVLQSLSTEDPQTQYENFKLVINSLNLLDRILYKEERHEVKQVWIEQNLNEFIEFETYNETGVFQINEISIVCSRNIKKYMINQIMDIYHHKYGSLYSEAQTNKIIKYSEILKNNQKLTIKVLDTDYTKKKDYSLLPVFKLLEGGEITGITIHTDNDPTKI